MYDFEEVRKVIWYGKQLEGSEESWSAPGDWGYISGSSCRAGEETWAPLWISTCLSWSLGRGLLCCWWTEAGLVCGRLLCEIRHCCLFCVLLSLRLESLAYSGHVKNALSEEKKQCFRYGASIMLGKLSLKFVPILRSWNEWVQLYTHPWQNCWPCHSSPWCSEY